MLGVGVGGPGGEGSDAADFEAYGADVHQRGARCDETLEVLTRLWSESGVTHEGRFFRLRDYTLVPRPHQRPHPPIWVGGHARGALRRAGRWADAYVPVTSAPGCSTPEDFDLLYAEVESYAEEYGRDPALLSRGMHIFICLADTPAEGARITNEVLSRNYQEPTTFAPDGLYLFGPPERCREIVQSLLDIGVSHFVLNMTCRPESSLSQLEVVAREILSLR